MTVAYCDLVVASNRAASTIAVGLALLLLEFRHLVVHEHVQAKVLRAQGSDS